MNVSSAAGTTRCTVARERGDACDQLVGRGPRPCSCEHLLGDADLAVGRADHRDLLGHVDPHRAPRDAAAAADAPARPELVDPRRELVREPLAVPGAVRRTRTSPNVMWRELLAEAAGPLAFARRARRRRARSLSVRSWQKHVGQTIVQFVQVRQRDPTSSQRGCSRFRCSSPGRSSVCKVRPIRAAATSVTGARPLAARRRPSPHGVGRGARRRPRCRLRR